MTEMENGNGNTERKKNRTSYSTVSKTVFYFCSFLVRLLHAGQRRD